MEIQDDILNPIVSEDEDEGAESPETEEAEE